MPAKKGIREKISLEELVALPKQMMGNPSRISKKISFVSNKTGHTELHLLDLETMKFTQLSHGEFPISPRDFHKWAPDDSYILFTKDPIVGNEKNNVFSISVPDGKVVQLTNTPNFRDDLGEVSHDGNWIVFASDRSKEITQLFRMNIDGSDVKQLTDHSRPVAFWYGFLISPDDKWIAYTSNESENLQNLDVWLVKHDGSEKKKIITMKDGSKEIVQAWSQDGKMLLFGSDHTGQEQVGIYLMDSNEVKWFGDRKAPEQPIVFTGDNKNIIVNRDVDAELKLVMYSIETGEEILLNIPPGSAGARYTTSDGKHLLCGHQDSTHRMSFLLYDLTNHAYKEIIPADYGPYSPADFHPDEYISYQSDGEAIYALLYKPKDLRPNEKLPAIVMPHGGPTAHYTRLFDEFAQVFVDKGYVLLQPNVRGSTGYGIEFRDACLSDWGGKDLNDIEAGVIYLKSLDYVDPKRIGITGASYGGYLTYMAVTKKPNLWKAASAYIGITSLKHLYDKLMETFPAIAYYFEEQMGKPGSQEVLDLWEDRSAINFVKNITAKLQIIQAENDPRCPVEQAEIFRNRLIEVGKKEGEDFEYVVLTDQGHGSLDIRQRIRVFKHFIKFFDKNL